MLKSAAEELRSATNTAASNALKRRLIGRLEVGCHVVMILGVAVWGSGVGGWGGGGGERVLEPGQVQEAVVCKSLEFR